MITKISRLRNCGIFRDFTWPAELPPFVRYNLIYGWNGSGKSTLSRLLQALQEKSTPDGEVTLTVSGNPICESQFAGAGVLIRVFNRGFVEKTVVATTQPGASGVPPIFIIGEENVEKQKQADFLRAEALKEQEAANIEQSAHTTAYNMLEAFYKAHAKTIKDRLTGFGSAYNNYNRATIWSKLLSLSTAPDLTPFILRDEQRAERLKQHHSTAKDEIPELGSIRSILPDLDALHGEVSALLRRTVTSTTIQSLRDDPPTAAWVQHGLGLHEKRNTRTCLFCSQPIPEDRLSQLNSHFSSAYRQFLAEIDVLAAKVQQASPAAELPNRAQLYDHLAAEYDAAVAILEPELSAFREALAFLAQMIASKRAKPFDILQLPEVRPALNVDCVEQVNAVIRKHNLISQDFARQIRAARLELENAYVADLVGEYRTLSNDLKAKGERTKALQEKSGQLTEQAKQLEREISQHQRPAEQLSHDLACYLGHNDITFALEGNGYRINRHGAPAMRLSEGETTAIALLYFLRSLDDRGFSLKDGIVVLDDPVCSLDQNGIFSAFSFIKERAKAAKQLFILTHNFIFFRQVMAWFKYESASAQRYVVECSHEGGQRMSSLRPLDRLLANYESEYHYLFKRVAEMAGSPGKSLEHYFNVPNMGRRLLESFLAFRMPRVIPAGKTKLVDGIWERLYAVDVNEKRRTRIYRFLNEYSHQDAIEGSHLDFSFLAETPSVMRDLLEMIRDADPQHYKGMMMLEGMPADPCAIAVFGAGKPDAEATLSTQSLMNAAAPQPRQEGNAKQITLNELPARDSRDSLPASVPV